MPIKGLHDLFSQKNLNQTKLPLSTICDFNEILRLIFHRPLREETGRTRAAKYLQHNRQTFFRRFAWSKWCLGFPSSFACCCPFFVQYLFCYFLFFSIGTARKGGEKCSTLPILYFCFTSTHLCQRSLVKKERIVSEWQRYENIKRDKEMPWMADFVFCCCSCVSFPFVFVAIVVLLLCYFVYCYFPCCSMCLLFIAHWNECGMPAGVVSPHRP